MKLSTWISELLHPVLFLCSFKMKLSNFSTETEEGSFPLLSPKKSKTSELIKFLILSISLQIPLNSLFLVLNLHIGPCPSRWKWSCNACFQQTPWLEGINVLSVQTLSHWVKRKFTAAPFTEHTDCAAHHLPAELSLTHYFPWINCIFQKGNYFWKQRDRGKKNKNQVKPPKTSFSVPIITVIFLCFSFTI